MKHLIPEFEAMRQRYPAEADWRGMPRSLLKLADRASLNWDVMLRRSAVQELV